MLRQKRRIHLMTNRGYIVLPEHQDFFSSALHLISVIDISESGAQISGVRDLKKNQALQLHWTPIPTLKPIMLDAVCVWSHQNKAGLRFKNPLPKAMYVIRSLVKFHLDFNSH